MTSSTLTSVVQSQLTSLDDTDCYATAWQRALQKADGGKVEWGGRGKGGRGLSRRTFQPKDIVVDGLRLEYAGNDGCSSRVLLESATLKLLSERVYALVGRNASGKSTLLRRIDAGAIPGFSPHVSTLYIPQETVSLAPPSDEGDGKGPVDTPMEILKSYVKKSTVSIQRDIQRLEDQMDELDMTVEEDQARMEELANDISQLQDEIDGSDTEFEKNATEALRFVGIEDEAMWNAPIESLSMGQRKKALLAVPLICRTDLLLLDEPTNGLDIPGLLMLRELIELCSESRKTTILLVSHDRDLIDDVADNVIDFFDKTLLYYPGNYLDYRLYRQQNTLHQIRQAMALEKKRAAMEKTLDNLKKKPVPRRGAGKKKAKQIESHRKKMERQGLEKDDKGHRRTNQKAGTGIKPGSINAIDASTRRGLKMNELCEMTKMSITPPPDKAVQFTFRQVASQWGEPLIHAFDVGHGYDVDPSALSVAGKNHGEDSTATSKDNDGELLITKKQGFLFDCVDLCIEEGQTYCIVGSCGSGKHTLLKLIAKLEKPVEGTITHATNLDVALLDQHQVESMIEAATQGDYDALSYLTELFPNLSEQAIRGELTSFGLNPQQATTKVRFLSGGERCRLCLAACMLRNPQLLCLKEPTANLDIESTEALVYGLSHWNGTVVMISHDTSFVRALDVKCFALVAEEGKLRRVERGIDAYLRSFA